MRLFELAHSKIKEIIKVGDCCIDATLGNGHDSLFLAQQISPPGRVFSFDIQESAIHEAGSKLDAAGLGEFVSIIHDCHTKIEGRIPIPYRGEIAIALYNLGQPPALSALRPPPSCPPSPPSPPPCASSLEIESPEISPGGLSPRLRSRSAPDFGGLPSHAQACQQVRRGLSDAHCPHQPSAPPRAPSSPLPLNPLSPCFPTHFGKNSVDYRPRAWISPGTR